MSDIGEAIGTAAEGGLFARAVAGKGGGSANKGEAPMDGGHFAEGACLNCGTELLGAHCHQCGQKAHLHRTLRAFGHDILHGALHFDGKTWRTLPKLAFKPGELTRRYIEGERARFVSPMALFLFSVFLMFAVFQAVGLTTPTEIPSTSQIETGISAAESRLVQARDAARAELARSDLSATERTAAERRLKEAEDSLGALKTTEQFALSEDGTAKMSIKDSGVPWIDDGLKKWRQNPGLMLYKLQTNFYKFSWLLIPLSIPFVWLLFAWKRRFKAYDHAIFVTYSLSFMTLLILALTVAGVAGLHEIFLFFGSLLIPPIHIYKHLRGTYALSRLAALWRVAILSGFIVVILLLFLQALILLGLF